MQTIVGDHTIRLASGRYFDILNPNPSDIHVEDIAHALAHICRFTGHTHKHYSVAQHSDLVSRIVPPEHALAALLHDAAEAYIGDVSSPLKRLLPDYKRIEQAVEAAVAARFGLSLPLDACIKQADMVLLRTEQRDLMGSDEDVWKSTSGFEPLEQRITPLPIPLARARFLARFDELFCGV